MDMNSVGDDFKVCPCNDKTKGEIMNTIKLLKSGEITNYVRCEECDYCRDTYKCKVLSAEEFETSDN